MKACQMSYLATFQIYSKLRTFGSFTIGCFGKNTI